MSRNRIILKITASTTYDDALAQVYQKTYDDGGCLIWTGAMTNSGYARIIVDGVAKTVRRVLAEKKIGRRLRGNEFAAATCNCKACVSGDHIRVITVATRRSEAGAAGGYSSPAKAAKIAAAKRATAKLTMDQVSMARADPRPSDHVAAELGVSGSMIRQIRGYHAWKDYSSPFRGL